jgi:hypothetical protein
MYLIETIKERNEVVFRVLFLSENIHTIFKKTTQLDF